MVLIMKWMPVLLFFLFLSGCAVNHTVMVGDEPVVIQQIGKAKTEQDKTYIHVHNNEQTALKAAKSVVRKDGGTVITLIHSGGRNIVFHLNNKRYEFDPNRIYTDVGIKKTLKQYSTYSPEAHREVKKLASQIKAMLPKGKVVAVHNNSGYSLKNYLPGHDMAKEAKVVHMSPQNYYRNFYLVTRLKDYARLKLEGFNGVLQKSNATDDGSLSVYLAKREYINVEAGYDQLPAQIQMLQRA